MYVLSVFTVGLLLRNKRARTHSATLDTAAAQAGSIGSVHLLESLDVLSNRLGLLVSQSGDALVVRCLTVLARLWLCAPTIWSDFEALFPSALALLSQACLHHWRRGNLHTSSCKGLLHHPRPMQAKDATSNIADQTNHQFPSS